MGWCERLRRCSWFVVRGSWLTEKVPELKVVAMRFALLFVVLSLFVPEVARADDAAASFTANVHALLKSHCAKCHGGEKDEAKIHFDAPRTREQLFEEQTLWFKVLGQIESGAMPPDGEPALTEAERKAIVDWIRGDFTTLLVAKQREEGRAKLRRLSRNEYANTVYDLFGMRPTVGLNLPEDGRTDGFDKVSTALPLSATGAAGYVKMTDDVLNYMLRPQPKLDPKTDVTKLPPHMQKVVRSVARESEQSKGHVLELEDGWKVSFNSDTTSCPNRGFSTSRPGLHKLKIHAYGYQTDKPMAVGIYAGHTGAYPQIIDLVGIVEVPPGKPSIIETEVYLRSRDLNDRSPVGDALRLIPFGLGVQVPKNTQATACKGPGLALQYIDVEQPDLRNPGDRWLTADFSPKLDEEMRGQYKKILNATGPKNQQAKSTDRATFLKTMETTFRRIGLRFFRRPLSDDELGGIVQTIGERLDSGTTIDRAFMDQVAALMTSPDFFCVIEQPGKLDDFALASRLSYFLWNSTPDDTLLQLAATGKLRDPQTLRAQTERLLADPKSGRFVNDFLNQWLGLRAIDDTSPDVVLYPEYAKNDLLKPSSMLETQTYFRKLLDENQSVRFFVDSPWVLANEALAKHYGLPPMNGVALKPVSLPADSPFGGLWTQPAILKVTANGTNTSPVKRGVWVAERLLGTPIPPPPPNINPIDPDTRGAKTLREQLALHRGTGSCASCHAKFDPFGFALESFDVAGSFRTKYREVDAEVMALPWQQRQGKQTWRDGLPVDCSGETPDGRAFGGPAELRKLLAADPAQLARGLTRHMVTYATGAPATGLDQRAIDAIIAEAAKSDYGVRSLVHALVQSELFQTK
jgi:mono/diheme cytochrome c family protein